MSVNRTACRRQHHRVVRTRHGKTYSRISHALELAQAAHYALEEGEYVSALNYLADAGMELTKARNAIIPELRPNPRISRDQNND